MKLTQKLLGLLHRPFDKDPHSFIALRLEYDGSMSWTVADGFLTTAVNGGSGQSLSIDLSQYTIGQLAVLLGQQQGYSIAYVDTSAMSLRSSRILIDGTGSPGQSNGDELLGYTNVLWSYIDANSNELEQAQTQIGEMLKQMSTTTASDVWLDNLGNMYGVKRLVAEPDLAYGPRIIAEVLRPKSNNVALEIAISAYTGQSTTVTDVVQYGATFPLYNGAITRNSTFDYAASARPFYGWFDVAYAYDLENGQDFTTFQSTVTSIIARTRAAGTQMRSLLLQSGSMLDTLKAPTDSFGNFTGQLAYADTLTAPTDAMSVISVTAPAFADTLTAPTDSESLTIVYGTMYNSVRSYNGSITRLGGQTVTESL